MDKLDFHQASRFCYWAHNGQLRKYSGEKYAIHPHRVAAATFMFYNTNMTVAVAALLHDTMEDQPERVNYELLAMVFGEEVAWLVVELTNERGPKTADLTRAQKKERDHRRLSGVSRNAKLIKLLDRQDNINDLTMCLHKGQLTDLAFPLLYCTESKQLIEVLRDSNEPLATRVLADINFLEEQALKLAAK